MIGYGRVGQAVATLLARRRADYEARLGEPVELASVLVRDTLRPRDTPLPEGVLYTDEDREFLGQEHDIVVECAGGTHALWRVLERCVRAGCDLVTSNQTLLATRAHELFALAEEHRVRVGYESALVGSVPLVAALERALGASDVLEFAGLLSATCNDVLTRTEGDDTGMSEAIGDAERAGITMPDRDDDLSGRNAAEKLAIVATLLYRRRVDVSDIRTTGIDRLTADDQRLARELGHAIRLVARAQQTPLGVYLRVAPMLIERSEPIANIRGPRAAAFIAGDPCGRVMLTGAGAGAGPVASALVSDLLAIAEQRAHKGEGRLNAWPTDAERLDIAPAGETVKRFYVRVPVRSHDGGIRALTHHLASFAIGVRTLHELPGTLVFITEPCSRKQLDAALDSEETSGLAMDERTVLRVYTPEWTL